MDPYTLLWSRALRPSSSSVLRCCHLDIMRFTLRYLSCIQSSVVPLVIGMPRDTTHLLLGVQASLAEQGK